MNIKKGFVLYIDNYEPIKDLTLEEKGKLLDAVFNYASTGEVNKLNDITGMAFSFIRQQLDRDNKKWEETREKRRAAGSVGGRQRVANQANATFAKQIKEDQANQAVSVNDNVKVKVEKIYSSKAMPPETAHEIFAELGGGSL